VRRVRKEPGTCFRARDLRRPENRFQGNPDRSGAYPVLPEPLTNDKDAKPSHDMAERNPSLILPAA